VTLYAEILSIGTELTRGEISDTNAAYLTAELEHLGIEVKRISVVGDDRKELITLFQEALSRVDLIVASGGLGPTEDDLTRECIASVLNEPLAVDRKLEENLREFFLHYGRRQMPPDNLKQAMIIPSARAINNSNGTAPGWWVEKQGKIIILLPGPPREMQPMWENEIVPIIKSRFSTSITMTRTLKIFGMSEATVNELAKPYFLRHNPSLGIYAKPDGINLRLIARGNSASKLLDDTEQELRALFKNHLWGKDEETLPDLVKNLLQSQKKTLAVMESGSAGIISDLLVNSGVGKFLAGSFVFNADKFLSLWQTSPNLLKSYSEVSEKTAEITAKMAREKTGADIGISTTGITGLDNETEPSGISFIGISDSNDTVSYQQITVPRRTMARQQLAMAALFRLREKLL